MKTGYKRFIIISLIISFITACETTKEQLGTILGATAGAVAAYNSGGSTKDRQRKAIAGFIVGGMLGKKIGAYLDAVDQQNLRKATAAAAKTGKNQTIHNPKTGVRINSQLVGEQPNAKVNLSMGPKVKTIPKLDIINKSYQSEKSVKVYAGPDEDYDVVGKLKSGEVVHVVGQVVNENWYMISKNNIANGYVHSSKLSKTTKPIKLAKKTKRQNTVQKTINVANSCRQIKNTITTKNGQTHVETVTACSTPNGWEII